MLLELGGDRNDRVQSTATSSNPLIAGARVAGTDVYNTAGDHLGEIYDVMLDKQTGKVAYAIMSFGGFLGLGREVPSDPVERPRLRHRIAAAMSFR